MTDALYELLYGPKHSATIHFDEDTIPHGACSDPSHCDCMCPHCWAKKVAILEPHLDYHPPGDE